jgi:hypothetical protein
MTAPIPEGISDLDSLGFYPLLLRQPLLPQCLSFDPARRTCRRQDSWTTSPFWREFLVFSGTPPRELTFLQHTTTFLASILTFLVVGERELGFFFSLALLDLACQRSVRSANTRRGSGGRIHDCFAFVCAASCLCCSSRSSLVF